MGKDTVPLQFIKMPPMSTFPRTILTRKRKTAVIEDLYEEAANFFSAGSFTSTIMILPLALLQHVHVLGPLALL